MTCHGATFGTSLTTCYFCSHAAALHLSLQIKVTDLACTESAYTDMAYTVRGHSVVFVTLLLDVYLTLLCFFSSVKVLTDKILN